MGDMSHVLSRRQTIDKVGQFRLPIKSAKKICRLTCKNWPNLSASKIVRFNCPSRTRSILDKKIAQLPRMPSCDWPTLFTRQTCDIGSTQLIYAVTRRNTLTS